MNIFKKLSEFFKPRKTEQKPAASELKTKTTEKRKDYAKKYYKNYYKINRARIRAEQNRKNKEQGVLKKTRIENEKLKVEIKTLQNLITK
jgi:hypothetical protein